MTDEVRAIWERMPEEDRARAEAAAPFAGLENIILLWDSAQRFEAAIEAREQWAGRRLRELKGPPAAEQDDLDERMIVRCMAGEYGPEAKHAVEEVAKSGQWGDRRATLRAARKAVQQVRSHQ